LRTERQPAVAKKVGEIRGGTEDFRSGICGLFGRALFEAQGDNVERARRAEVQIDSHAFPLRLLRQLRVEGHFLPFPGDREPRFPEGRIRPGLLADQQLGVIVRPVAVLNGETVSGLLRQRRNRARELNPLRIEFVHMDAQKVLRPFVDQLAAGDAGVPAGKVGNPARRQDPGEFTFPGDGADGSLGEIVLHFVRLRHRDSSDAQADQENQVSHIEISLRVSLSTIRD